MSCSLQSAPSSLQISPVCSCKKRKEKYTTLHSYAFPKGLYCMQFHNVMNIIITVTRPQCGHILQCHTVLMSYPAGFITPVLILSHTPQHRAPGRMSDRFVPDYSPQLMAVWAGGVSESRQPHKATANTENQEQRTLTLSFISPDDLQ